jgi:signal transduction histidine kinase
VATDYANTFIHSKIGSKIAIFLFILFFLVIMNFVIVSYYQSQMTYLGNSINIAGKNRFLTSNLMLDVSEYLNIESNTKSSSEIKSSMNQLESNILALRQGGNIAGIDLKPLPRDFLTDWNTIYQKWILLKTKLTNMIIDSPDEKMNSEQLMDRSKELSLLETEALSLIDSSNLLVTKLSDYLKSNSEYSLSIQQINTILIVIVTIAFAFYISSKILRPIISLTSTTISEINGERLNVIIGQNKGNNNNNNNEVSVLNNSFNYMVNYIKNIKKQDKLIRELEKANDELKYKDQLKNDFINIAAHEIKTPIQPIIALSAILQQEGITNIEKNKEYLDIIFRNSKRLKQITDDVLDVARIESGSFSLTKEKFNLKELIIDILKEYEQKINKKNNNNIKLYYEFSDNNNEIIVEADRNRISQVIHNLLDNAIKFTEKGSITIIVETKKDNTNNKQNEILISIKDTGTGIHPDILPKLFTKFVTKSPIPGTGLGLFISKCIIEMHDGKIWAINNKELDREKGIGSTFTFSLPIKQ